MAEVGVSNTVQRLSVVNSGSWGAGIFELSKGLPLPQTGLFAVSYIANAFVLFELLDFIARLAALVPKPRVNLTRFHGVFAPNSKQRALVTPARRGKGNKSKLSDEEQDQTPTERRSSMTWAQRLNRVFTIDIETCRECGGAVRIIACIEDPVLMPKALATLAGQALKKILAHLKEKGVYQDAFRLPESRGPPQTSLFGNPPISSCCQK